MHHGNRFYISFLVLSLAMLPSAVLAQRAIIDGAKKQQNTPIISHLEWTVLLSTVVNLPDAASPYKCEVTCTSTVNNPVSAVNDEIYYYAAFNAVDPNVTDGCVRPFDFSRDRAGHNKLVVATTCFLPGLENTQTFSCLGRKAVPADNAIVDNTSMHVICIR